jgi:hypothetical protein
LPVFDAADAENPPVRMDDWDEDELVYLRPHVTYLMDQRARGKALAWPEDVTPEALRAMDPDEVQKLAMASVDQARIDEELLVAMIERWTLRRQPTKQQRERGERGSLVPLTREAIAQLPPAVGAFLRAEIEKRRDIVPPEAMTEPDGTPFRPAVEPAFAGLDAEHGGPAGAADANGGGSHRAHRMERGRA